jgi:hypothetical protein
MPEKLKKPNDFRSLGARSHIAANVCLAARLLENSMVRAIAHGDRGAEAVVTPRLGATAAGLREALNRVARELVSVGQGGGSRMAAKVSRITSR